MDTDKELYKRVTSHMGTVAQIARDLGVKTWKVKEIQTLEKMRAALVRGSVSRE